MNYTVEDIKGMSDFEIEEAVADLVFDECWHLPPHDERNETDGWVYGRKVTGISSVMPKYCSDWSAIGPLMVEHGVSLILPTKLTPNHIMCEAICDDIYAVSSNPLRAVCEVLLMNVKEEL